MGHSVYIYTEIYCCFQVQSYNSSKNKDSWTTQAVIWGSYRPEKISVKTSALKLTYRGKFENAHTDGGYGVMKFNVTYQISLPKNTGKFGLILEYNSILLVTDSL